MHFHYSLHGLIGMTAIVCQFLWSGITSDEDKNKTEGRQYLLKVRGLCVLSRAGVSIKIEVASRFE